MADWLKVVLMGIVEGVTEFLPISSTGHLAVAGSIINYPPEHLRFTFEIFIQIGAVLAVIAYYWRDLFRQVREVRRDASIQRLWLAIVVAAIPAGVAGFLLADWLDDNIFREDTINIVVGVALILGGIVFLVIEGRPPAQVTTTEVGRISLSQALIVGLLQTLALIPGVSRSGASIVAGMLTGMSRPVATAFSFYLSIPVLGGATLFALVRSLNEITSADLAALFLGAAVSLVVAWLAIGWLLRYVARNNFIPFGYYRIAAGALILLLVATGTIG
jgi:undecaprenyl-diphosphatase